MIRAKGSGGQLLVGYQIAAHLGDWSLDPAEEDGALVTFTVTERHPFWGTQTPTKVRLKIGARFNEWEASEVSDTCVAVRGLPRTIPA